MCGCVLVQGVVPHVCGVRSHQVYEAMALMHALARSGGCETLVTWKGQAMRYIICTDQCRSAGPCSAVAVHCRGCRLLPGEG